ncbi:uncharacterized protein LOC103519831, partial [Diaphorina citri]|uniref:Uncharacterized protein LOC103519831 n=1 Tax=Diaphorina citri TaxID=121845 RepID=A0A1S3DJG7_DIACI
MLPEGVRKHLECAREFLLNSRQSYVIILHDKVVRYDQIPAPGVSHYDLLFLAYSVKVPKYPAQTVSYRNIEKIDMERFSECLSEVDWSGVEADVTIDEKVSIFNEHVQQVFDIFAPVKESRVTKAPVPWMTPAIKSSMRERDRLYIRYRHTRQQDALQAYKAKKNATNYM